MSVSVRLVRRGPWERRWALPLAPSQTHALAQVLRNDYFLSGWADAFLSEARQLIFETYCRIHRKIDINMLGQKLGAWGFRRSFCFVACLLSLDSLY